MPANFTIEPERRLVRSRGWGSLTDADLRQTQRELREAPEFGADFRQLYDFSEVTDLRVTGEGLRDLARHSPFARDARRAIVVASDAAYGMVRMYQLSSDRDSEHVRIFRDLAGAIRWLDGETPRSAADGNGHA